MKKHIILLASACLLLLASCANNHPTYQKNTGLGGGKHKAPTCKSSGKY
jgi:protein involved in sex pheromone biosynthesis